MEKRIFKGVWYYEIITGNKSYGWGACFKQIKLIVETRFCWQSHMVNIDTNTDGKVRTKRIADRYKKSINLKQSIENIEKSIELIKHGADKKINN